MSEPDEPLPPATETIHMAGPWVTALEARYVQDAMTNWYDGAYEYCERLQREFAAWHDRRWALMTPNCTQAIHLLLAGLGIGPGDEVIVPEITWIATAAPVTYQRATPVFADVDPVSWCLDPASAERAIGPRTKAIIAVDVFGNMAEMDALRALAERHGVLLVEDAAEALGSTYNGVRAGKFGVGSTFSFHRTKTMTTGEGGMLLVDDDGVYQRCKFLRDHGRVEGRPYWNSEVTFKYMPNNVQAALGYGQFQRLPRLVARKREIFRKYVERLADVPDLTWNPEPPHVHNSVWTTALVFGKTHAMTKARAIAELAALGVPARPFFYPLSSLPAFPGAEATYGPRNPVAYDVSDRAINLSCAMNLTDAQIDRITDGVRRILGVRRSS